MTRVTNDWIENHVKEMYCNGEKIDIELKDRVTGYETDLTPKKVWQIEKGRNLDFSVLIPNVGWVRAYC